MREPGYETLDAAGAGRPLEYTGRGGMRRQPVDIGRYARGQAVTTGRHDVVSDVELRQMRLRLLELEQLS